MLYGTLHTLVTGDVGDTKRESLELDTRILVRRYTEKIGPIDDIVSVGEDLSSHLHRIEDSAEPDRAIHVGSELHVQGWPRNRVRQYLDFLGPYNRNQRRLIQSARESVYVHEEKIVGGKEMRTYPLAVENAIGGLSTFLALSVDPWLSAGMGTYVGLRYLNVFVDNRRRLDRTIERPLSQLASLVTARAQYVNWHLVEGRFSDPR